MPELSYAIAVHWLPDHKACQWVSDAVCLPADDRQAAETQYPGAAVTWAGIAVLQGHVPAVRPSDDWTTSLYSELAWNSRPTTSTRRHSITRFTWSLQTAEYNQPCLHIITYYKLIQESLANANVKRATAVHVWRHMTSIGTTVAKLWPFLYVQDGRQLPSWILSNRK